MFKDLIQAYKVVCAENAKKKALADLRADEARWMVDFKRMVEEDHLFTAKDCLEHVLAIRTKIVEISA